MTSEEFMKGATVVPLGEDWGTPPLWRFENDQAAMSVEVRGKDEAAARAAAREALPGLLGEPT